MKETADIFDRIQSSFKTYLSLSDWEAPKQYFVPFREMEGLICHLSVEEQVLQNKILEAIIEKLDLYNNITKSIIDECAKEKIYFNYHEKLLLKSIIAKKDKVSAFLKQHGISEIVINRIINYHVYTSDEIRREIFLMIREDKKWREVVNSIFARVLFNCFKFDEITKFLSKTDISETNYFKFLREFKPEKFERLSALTILTINKGDIEKTNYKLFIDNICGIIEQEYIELNNHSYLSIILNSDILGLEDGQSTMWSVYSDIVLFAEKHYAEELKIGYFHPDIIKEKTIAYTGGDSNKSNFEIAYGGFTYKDCYVIPEHNILHGENFTNYSLILFFQKNHRDEDIIPCPACRSTNVRGNSYPTIGVKSWECHNPICPEKSKYNRGKRYSFASILKQESIENIDNEIEKELINNWRLDLVTPKTQEEILEFIIKEYSFFGDTVKILASHRNLINNFGRKLLYMNIPENKTNSRKFFEGPFFSRFIVEDNKSDSFKEIELTTEHKVFNGNCRDVLDSLPNNFADGAVTSPPYYNAKEYSNWDNIYCYLYDMYNHAKKMYNTLKPGAIYIYNIFDYFDNENNLVFSDMGKKRMILGAYIINIFKRLGFKLKGNTLWYKGHIQGNRSNNQGNNSPYYQSPLNCYEHILWFQKPGEVDEFLIPTILNASPVIKIIKGENRLGHTAPFPSDIPALLAKRIKNGVIIDPYAGSFTTARTVRMYGLSSISIEQSEDYCKLGISLFQRESCLNLF